MRGCDEPGFDDWYRGFEVIGVKAMRRANIVIPENLKTSFQGDDLTISFDLPNGSHATALLREIVAYNTSFDREEDTLG